MMILQHGQGLNRHTKSVRYIATVALCWLTGTGCQLDSEVRRYLGRTLAPDAGLDASEPPASISELAPDAGDGGGRPATPTPPDATAPSPEEQEQIAPLILVSEDAGSDRQTGDSGVMPPPDMACSNAILDGQETAEDCGGRVCEPCALGRTCAENGDCRSGLCFNVCIAAGCDNGFQDQPDETDVDCGGPCDPCAQGQQCVSDGDCVSRLCREERCAPPECDDNVLNGAETGVDCGGSSACGACGDGQPCKQQSDCMSGLCARGQCAPAHCENAQRNEGESDVDCGGPCPPCAAGALCGQGAECESTLCIATEPRPATSAGQDASADTGPEPNAVDAGADAPMDGVCTSASCKDGARNGTESGIDCGGDGQCPRCGPRARCVLATDCESGVCASKEGSPHRSCLAASCSDGVRNGTESDIDCGSDCPACDDSLSCSTDRDCHSQHCLAGLCAAATCEDGRQNQGELDIDCAGPCAAGCSVDVPCAAAEDCLSGLCELTCAAGSAKALCQEDADCLSQSCSLGACAPSQLDGQCRVDADCTTARCRSESCVPGFFGAACSEDAHCQSGSCQGAQCAPGALGAACEGAQDCHSQNCLEQSCAPIAILVESEAPHPNENLIQISFSLTPEGASGQLPYKDLAVLYFFSPEQDADLRVNWQESDVGAVSFTYVEINASQWAFVWRTADGGQLMETIAAEHQIHDASWAAMNVSNDYSFRRDLGNNDKIVLCKRSATGWHQVYGTAPSSVTTPCRYVEPPCEEVRCVNP